MEEKKRTFNFITRDQLETPWMPQMRFARTPLKTRRVCLKGCAALCLGFLHLQTFSRDKGSSHLRRNPSRRGGTAMRVSRATRGSRINVNRSDSHWKEGPQTFVEETGRVLLRHSEVNAPVFRFVPASAVRPTVRDNFCISDRFADLVRPDTRRKSVKRLPFADTCRAASFLPRNWFVCVLL